jgi:signal transduction histidine kinase
LNAVTRVLGNHRRVPLWIGAVVFVTFAVGTTIAAHVAHRDVWEAAGLLIPSLGFVVVGSLIVSRGPENRMGWVFWLSGVLWATGSFAVEYSKTSYTYRPLPGGLVAAWFAEWYWLPWLTLILSVGIVLFPDGRLPSRKWRWFARITWGGMGILTLLAALDQTLNPGKPVVNPIGIAHLDPDSTVLAIPFVILLWTGAIGSVAALIVRFRRTSGEERLQMKWFVYATAILVASFLVLVVADATGFLRPLLLDGFFMSLPPIAAGVAILKYRLYDIDVVINKTIVFGVLAAFITGVYVAIVVGIGSLAGSSDEPNLALSIAATAVVAIAFSPVRDRVQRVANRLVYGKRQTPYEAVARFADEVVSSYETHQVAPAIATTIAEATGAARAEVWLKVDDTLVCQATHPPTDHTPTTVALNGAELPALQDVDLAVAVTHNNELLGALSLTKKRGEQPQPGDRKLLDDLSSHAGIVLANARMTAELEAHLAHITAQARAIKQSRQRIVAAQDKERRRLERDIHDGAQQHLVALAVKLNLAKTTAARKPEKAPALLTQLKTDTQEALSILGDLARGIYPPVLKDNGIAKALELNAQKAPFEVTITDHTTARFDEAVETAVYFCCLEALQNTAKYAQATRATVTLTETDDTLGFVVTDDGHGFDPSTTTEGTGTQGMADRLAAVDGTLTVTSAPGQGTTVAGNVPIRQRAVT